jgi:uncharacterized protein (DUF1778 family)
MAVSQVNIRLDSRKLEILEAAAFVDGRSVPEFVRATIEGLADQLADDPAVLLALQARDERSRRAAPNIAGFPTKHRVRAADA